MLPTLKPAPSAHSTLAQLIGQKLIVRMKGLTPSAGLLDRIRRGEVGGVILFGENVTTPSALVQLVEDVNADLLVVGNVGTNTIVGRVLGSVPRAVSHRAKTEVLVVETDD